MRLREYADYLEDLRASHPHLAADFAPDSLENVLQWMARRGLPSGSVDLVGQDEFSYDFLIELEPAGRFLVFGVN